MESSSFPSIVVRVQKLIEENWDNSYLQPNAAEEFIELLEKPSGWFSTKPDYATLLFRAASIVNDILLDQEKVGENPKHVEVFNKFWTKVEKHSEGDDRVAREVRIARRLLLPLASSENAALMEFWNQSKTLVIATAKKVSPSNQTDAVSTTSTAPLKKQPIQDSEAPFKECLKHQSFAADWNQKLKDLTETYKRIQITPDHRLTYKSGKDESKSLVEIEAYFVLHPACQRIRILNVAGAPEPVVFTREKWESYKDGIAERNFGEVLAEIMKDAPKNSETPGPDEIGAKK